MENLYATLRNKIVDFDIIYTEPLSYLKTIVSEKSSLSKCRQKAFILCKKDQIQTKVNEIIFKKPIKREKEEDLNLTGSPLRDNCEIDYIEEDVELASSWNNLWSEYDETYRAVPIARAQQILSEIAMEPNIRDTTITWAICDKNNGNKLLTFLNLLSDWNRRGIVTFTGFSSFDDISLVDLNQKHLSIFRSPQPFVEVEIDAYFQLNSGLNNIILQLSLSVSDSLHNVRLNNYEKYSRITLHQSVFINNHVSVAETFWRQINILNNIKNSIVQFKMTRNSDDLVYNFGSSMELIEVKQRIFKCFTDMPQEYVQNDEDDVNTDIETIIEKAKFRDSDELTDQLWEVLKACSSYADLKLAFEYVFNCAVKYNIVNVSTNKNRLAKWITDLSEKSMAVPHLNGSEPLELLIEIGIDKITRDYEFIFTESKLCSAENLKYSEKSMAINESEVSNVRKSLKTLINDNSKPEQIENNLRKTLMHTTGQGKSFDEENEGIRNSNFNKINIEKKLAHLGQIHLILEHLLSIRSTFYHENVYTDFLEDLKRPAKLFHLLNEQKVDSRKIHVANSKILNRIESQLPSQLRIMFSSANNMLKVENTFFYSNRPAFPPNVFECIPADSKPNNYYGHHLVNISTRAS